MVELFQAGKFDILLLSTGAGGVGLTLTRASRVIVYDPSWNPAQGKSLRESNSNDPAVLW